jgi:hypothetical protein
MADPDTSPQPTEEAAQSGLARTESAQPAEPTIQSDLASLLSEFESATTPKPEPAPQAPQQPAPDKAPQYGDPIEAGMAGFPDLARAHELEGQVKNLTAEVNAARHYLDTQHFDQAVTAGEKMLQDAELYVPPDFVRGQLIAMATLNPQLAQAFDNRGQNPQAYARMLKKAHASIMASAKAMPDAAATSDRNAVAAAVRGTSTKHYVDPPPKYGDMTDAEFQKEKAKFGF